MSVEGTAELVQEQSIDLLARRASKLLQILSDEFPVIIVIQRPGFNVGRFGIGSRRNGGGDMEMGLASIDEFGAFEPAHGIILQRQPFLHTIQRDYV